MKENDGIIPQKIKDILSEGLLEGFARNTIFERVRRGGNAFALDSSHLEPEDENRVYHDEWLAERVGGGQELVDTFPERERWTRVYAGGTVKKEVLDSLGLTVEKVNSQLQETLKQLGDKTRLDANCKFKNGLWTYDYEVFYIIRSVPMIAAVEIQEYTDKIVFAQGIINSPVE